jgi:hypothetical protein
MDETLDPVLKQNFLFSVGNVINVELDMFFFGKSVHSFLVVGVNGDMIALKCLRGKEVKMYSSAEITSMNYWVLPNRKGFLRNLFGG